MERIRLVGKNKDMMQLTLREDASRMVLSAVDFNGLENLRGILKELYPAEDCDKIIQYGKLPMALDFVYSIDINSYNGRQSVQLVIRDFRVSK